uniref:Uncharacterized protein n=1 Tax=Anguilla anguilla TaxID=7936 RepID=A0A0E9X4Z3_ANGAN
MKTPLSHLLKKKYDRLSTITTGKTEFKVQPNTSSFKKNYFQINSSAFSVLARLVHTVYVSHLTWAADHPSVHCTTKHEVLTTTVRILLKTKIWSLKIIVKIFINIG